MANFGFIIKLIILSCVCSNLSMTDHNQENLQSFTIRSCLFSLILRFVYSALKKGGFLQKNYFFLSYIMIFLFIIY